MGLFKDWYECKEREEFFDMVDGMVETLDIFLDRLAYEPYHEKEIEKTLINFDLTLEKMVDAFLQTGNERLLGQIEELKRLNSRLRILKKNATAM
jgi:SMC interacting uncharacterized protein involved in chromosome segregation